MNSLLLVITAMIWGLAFVAQSSGTELIGSFTFNCARSVLGIITLLPLTLYTVKKVKPDIKYTAFGGFCCGIAMFIASNLQQIGIAYPTTTAGKAGFITALYSVLVPVFGLFTGRKTKLKVWISVLISAAGMYLLCVKEGFKIAPADFILFGCAVFFAIQILFINHFSERTDGIVLSFFQLITVAVFSGTFMFIFEEPDMGNLLESWVSVAYTGVFSTGIAYTLQVVAQKKADPTVASIIMSLESVFAAIFGAIILKEELSARELLGCAIIFASVIISQLPDKKSPAESK